MSMVALTIRQLIQIFAVYTLVTVVLPAWIFGRRFRRFRLAERFLMYVLIGNFYMMNSVFLLQLLHISNAATLWILTVLVVFVAYTVVNQRNTVEEFYNILDSLTRFLGGITGRNTMRMMARITLRQKLAELLLWLRSHVFRRAAEWILAAAILAQFLYLHGANYLHNFGYYYSDIIVHNYWINALSQGKIFVAGVYPMGFHGIIYYLHTMFGIDTYVLLRLFGLISLTYIVLVLLAVLRCLCKARWTPYLGTFLFTGSGLLMWNKSLLRYTSALPQESGVLFLLPSLYFLMAYITRRTRELKEKLDADMRKGMAEGFDPQALEDAWELEKEGFDAGVAARRAVSEAMEANGGLYLLDEEAEREKAKWRVFFDRVRRKHPIRNILRKAETCADSATCLVMFVLSFGMTLSAHFYVTIIAGVGCVAIAIGYFGKFIRRKCLLPILCAGVVSVVIAIAPMLIAYLGGTPLEGSLYWAMSFFSADAGAVPDPSGDVEILVAGVAAGAVRGASRSVAPAAMVPAGWFPVLAANAPIESTNYQFSTLTTLRRRLSAFHIYIEGSLVNYIFDEPRIWNISLFDILEGIFALALVLGLLIRFRDAMQGRAIVSMAILCALMTFLFGLGMLGLPQIMDASRISVFYGYLMIPMIALTMDGLVDLAVGRLESRIVSEGVQGALLAGCLAVVFLTGWYRMEPVILGESELRDNVATLSTRGAIASLGSIIGSRRDFTWTIVSANDETRMGEDHGYHYELSTFLRKQEGYDPEESSVFIPTEYVYFYVEKIPVDYTYPYEDSGQTISVEGAETPLPIIQGIGPYEGWYRWVLMSKMYAWAETFRELYPNEMQVFYEDEEFVCYCIHQNLYALYNFAIDYTYNTMEYASGAGEEEA